MFLGTRFNYSGHGYLEPGGINFGELLDPGRRISNKEFFEVLDLFVKHHVISAIAADAIKSDIAKTPPPLPSRR